MGTLQLVPWPGSTNWTYRIDLEGNDTVDHAGAVDRPISIDFSFDSPGIHRILVVLTGPSGEQIVERSVLAIDPAFDPGPPLFAQRLIEALYENLPFEGIAVEPSGGAVYVATFFGSGHVFRLDPETLGVLDSVQMRHGVEGLAVSPDNDVLFAIHKAFGITLIDIPSMGIQSDTEEGIGGFFIHALDSDRALVSGHHLVGLVLYSVAAASVLSELDDTANVFDHFHFSVHSSTSTVAVTVPRVSSVVLADLPSLALKQTIEIPGLRPRYVTFHPDGEILYVLADDPVGIQHFLVVDIASSTVLQMVMIGRSLCSECVANPVATSREGRWVVFAHSARALFIDTENHIPMIAGPLGSGVAASPVRDEFYFVDGAGVVSRVGYPVP